MSKAKTKTPVPNAKTASGLRVVELSNGGGYILPKVSESSRSRKAWVEYGIASSDDFFSEIIKAYETSPTNQAAIDSCTDLIYGKGVKAKDNQPLEDYLYNLTTDEEIRKITFDYKLFGNAAIQAVFNTDRDKIIGFYHIPVDTLRCEKVDDLGNIPGFYYSPDWNNRAIKPKYIPAFGQNQYEDDVQIIYFKKYSPGKFYYGIPDYYSCIQYCAVEEEISNLHVNNIKNNFMPSTIINFNGGVPAVEEQYMVEQSIVNKFAGTTNAGKFILSFNENPEYKTTVEMLRPENLHQQYDFIAEESSRKIMLAHRITSQMLLGIKTATGFSSNADELKTSYEIFYAMVINPMQQEIVKQIQAIVEFNGYDAESLYFAPLIPFGFLAELMNEAGASNAQEIIENPNDVPDLEDQQIDTTNGENPGGMAPNPNETIGDVVGPENVGVQGLSRMVRDWDSFKLNENYEVTTV